MIFQGKVAKVYVNDSKEGKYGPFWPQVVEAEDGARYSIISNTSTPVANPGDSVEFAYEQNQKGDKTYNNITNKTFNNKGGGQAAPQGNAGGAAAQAKQQNDSRTSDIKRGRAVNVAVELFAGGVVEKLEDGLRQAVRLEVLSDAYYDRLYEEEKQALGKKNPEADPPAPAPEQDEDGPPF